MDDKLFIRKWNVFAAIKDLTEPGKKTVLMKSMTQIVQCDMLGAKVLIYEICGISEMFAVLLLLFVFLSVLK